MPTLPLLLLCVLALSWVGATPVQADEEAIPVEWGDVAWIRDFDAALEQAKAKQRSLLVLFQEVPG